MRPRRAPLEGQCSALAEVECFHASRRCPNILTTHVFRVLSGRTCVLPMRGDSLRSRWPSRRSLNDRTAIAPLANDRVVVADAARSAMSRSWERLGEAGGGRDDGGYSAAGFEMAEDMGAFDKRDQLSKCARAFLWGCHQLWDACRGDVGARRIGARTMAQDVANDLQLQVLRSHRCLAGPAFLAIYRNLPVEFRRQNRARRLV